MLFKEITNKEFIGFTNKLNNTSIYQTPEYGYIMNNQGYENVLLGMYDNDNMVAASLILINKENGFKYAYAPKGFLLDYENEMTLFTFTNYIKKYLNKKGVIGIKINPLIIKSIYKSNNIIENPKYNNIYNILNNLTYYHLGYNNFFESLKPRFEAVIDLSKKEEDIFNNIKKEYRTKIRSGYNNGIRVYKGDINTLEYIKNFTEKKYDNFNYLNDCFKYYSKRNMIEIYYTKLDTNIYLKNIQNKLNYYEEKRNHYNDEIIRKSYSNPYNLINKKLNIDKYYNQYQTDLIRATKLLREQSDGIITSAVLVIKNQREVTIYMDSYDKKYKKLNSKHLLIWQLITIYKKEGYTKFNLGGMSNIYYKDNKYNGLNEFKMGFGADIYEYAGDFELITNKRNYELYRNFVPLKNLIKNKLIK